MKRENFTLRTDSEVLSVEKSPDGTRTTGVTYVDTSGEEFFQPAEVVVLCAYPLENARLMLLSDIGTPYDPQTGEGVVGKNYCYQVMSGATVFYDEEYTNGFVGAGALGMAVNTMATISIIPPALSGAVISPATPTRAHREPSGARRRAGLGQRMKQSVRAISSRPRASVSTVPQWRTAAIPRPRSHLYRPAWQAAMRMTYDFTSTTAA